MYGLSTLSSCYLPAEKNSNAAENQNNLFGPPLINLQAWTVAQVLELANF